MGINNRAAPSRKAVRRGATKKGRDGVAQSQGHDSSAQKTDALKQALAHAFESDATRAQTPSTSSPRGLLDANVADSYGKGSPTDRLQFGYAPAITAEAVAYHSSIAAANWVAQRRANWKLIYQQRHKLQQANCEPLTSVLKLRSHWDKLSHFNAELRGNLLERQDVDELVDVLASKQRVSKECE